MRLINLEVNGRHNPLGTAMFSLRFSWQFGPSRVPDPQGWWRIRVIAEGGALVWDSGTVAGSDPWALSPPDVRFAAWVRHTWNLDIAMGSRDCNASGNFTPAPVEEVDWLGALWISHPRASADFANSTEGLSPRQRCHDGSLAAPVLTRSISSLTPVRRALLAVAAGGHADVRIDGQLATDEVLSPGTTHWNKRVQVVLHDVTSSFPEMSNGVWELGLELGRGFYGMTNVSVWAWERAPWHAKSSARAVLRLEHVDGTVTTVPTGTDWSARGGTILLDDLYGGEVVDLRRRVGGSNVAPTLGAVAVVGPAGQLEPRLEQPERIAEELTPTDIVQLGPGEWLAVFPRVVAGWVRLRLPGIDRGGRAGDTVRIRYGERLGDDGLPNASDDNGYFADGFQTDEVTLDGSETVWEPRFSYKGFRYVHVSGWPDVAGAKDADIIGCVVHTDAARRTEFAVDDPLLQWIHDATVSTMENNLHGYPTDTPKYEKNGWTGDAALGAEMFLTELDAAPVLTKWVMDVADTVSPGHPPALTAPNAGIFGIDAEAAVWHSALVTVPWDIYWHTGDSSILARHAATIEDYARFEFARSVDGIANTTLGDWVAPGTDPGGGNPPEDSRIPATAFLFRILDRTADIARVLDRDARWFVRNAETVRAAFLDEFLRDGIVRGSADAGFRQTHQVLALAFNIVREPSVRQGLADALAHDVRARGDHLDTGALGTKWLLPVLSDLGHAETALAIAQQTTPPSWGAWWLAGATSTFEHWDLAARSHGHYFLGTVDDWLTGYVAGIRPMEAGWRRILIAPAVTRGVSRARCAVRTPFGRSAVEWWHADGRLIVEVTIPPGVTAEIRLPHAGVRTRTAGKWKFVTPIAPEQS